MNELTTSLTTTFAKVECFSTNIVSSDGWYADNGPYRHMTYEIKNFNMFKEQDEGICVELDDDAMYLVKGLLLYVSKCL